MGKVLQRPRRRKPHEPRAPNHPACPHLSCVASPGPAQGPPSPQHLTPHPSIWSMGPVPSLPTEAPPFVPSPEPPEVLSGRGDPVVEPHAPATMPQPPSHPSGVGAGPRPARLPRNLIGSPPPFVVSRAGVPAGPSRTTPAFSSQALHPPSRRPRPGPSTMVNPSTPKPPLATHGPQCSKPLRSRPPPNLAYGRRLRPARLPLVRHEPRQPITWQVAPRRAPFLRRGRSQTGLFGPHPPAYPPFVVSRARVRRRPVSNHKAHSNQAPQTVPYSPRPIFRRGGVSDPPVFRSCGTSRGNPSPGKSPAVASRSFVGPGLRPASSARSP